MHGMPAVRDGGFQETIARTFAGPSLHTGVPRDRLVSDLDFAIRSAPFSVWTERSFEEGQARDAAIDGRQWLEIARTVSHEWLDAIAASDAEQLKLEAFLMSRQRKNVRLVLGNYFGLLVEYWLDNCPRLGVSNLHAGVRVGTKGTTLGALKYVWLCENTNRIVHFECSVKFFCRLEQFMVGPHLSETLATRYRFAKRKLQVAQVAKPMLVENLFKKDIPLTSVSILYGYLFYPCEFGTTDLVASQLAENGLTMDVGHEDYLEKGHLRGWYTCNFVPVLKKFSGTLENERERWAVLPKLYWLSDMKIPASNVEQYGVPFLERDDMLELVSCHFGRGKSRVLDPDCSQRRIKRANRASGLAPECSSPLLVAQLVLDESGELWVEQTRGFILPKKWDATPLLVAEKTGGRVPNEPKELDIETPEKLNIILKGASDEPKKVKTNTADGKCTACAEMNLEESVVNVDTLSLKIRNIANALLQEHPSKTQVISNRHTEHVIHALSKAMQEHWTPEEISQFVANALIDLHDEQLDWVPQQRKLLARVVHRAGTLAHDEKSDQDNFLLVDSLPHEVRSSYISKCIARRDCVALNFILDDRSTLDYCGLGPHDRKLVQTFAHCLLEADEQTDHQAETLIAFIRLGIVSLDQSQIYQFVRDLILNKRIDQVEKLVDFFLQQGNRDITTMSFRVAITDARSWKAANRLLNRYSLHEQYPRIDLSVADCKAVPDNLPKLETHLLTNVELFYIDDERTLLQGKHLLGQARELAGGHLVVGVDAEWGNDAYSPQENTKRVPAYLSLWQIAINKDKVLILDLEVLHRDPHLLKLLVDFFCTEFDESVMTMVGFSLQEDFNRLHHMFREMLDKKVGLAVVDAQCVLAAFTPAAIVRDYLGGDAISVSLRRWVRILLKKNMDKTFQCSDWVSRPLSSQQIQYAALDAIVPPILVSHVIQATNLANWVRSETLG